MVLLLNIELPDGNANKRLMENGYRSSNSGNAPKYKSRKVSSVRDFPSMCGQNDQSFKSEPMGIQSRKDLESKSVDVEHPKEAIGKEAEALIKEFDKGGGIALVKSRGEVGVKPFVEVGHLVCKEVLVTDDDVSSPKNKFCRRRVSAIRDFPPYCGRNVPSMQERLKITSGENLLRVDKVNVEKRMTMASKAGADSKELKDGENSSSPIDILPAKIGTSLKQLGTSVEVAALVESGTAGGPIVGDVQDCGFQESQAKGTVFLCKNTSDVVRTSKDVEEGEGSVSKDIILCALDNTVDRRILDNDFGSGNDDDRFIVTALMSAQYCPWRKGRKALSSRGGITRGNLNEGKSNWRGKSKAVAAPVESVTDGGQLIKGDARGCIFLESQTRGMVSLPENFSDAVISKHNEQTEGPVSKELVLFAHDNTDDRRASDNCFGSESDHDRVIVTALMAAPYCPRRRGKVASISGGEITRGNVNNNKSTWRVKSKAVAKKAAVEAEASGRPSLNERAVSASEDADGTLVALVVNDEENSTSQNEEPPYYSTACSLVNVNFPPFGSSSSNGDDRNRVRETLRLFQVLCRDLLLGQESRAEEERKSKQSEKNKRIDLQAAKIIKEMGKEVNTGKQYIGAVPGVEVGDEFQYRVELAIVGVHCLYQASIDFMKHNGMLIATSIVASGAYDGDMENADVLIYSGQGGNVIGKDKQQADQKLEKGNLALLNSLSTKTPVRVIRGSKEAKASDSQDSTIKLVASYIYDGLYTVENCREKTGSHGKLVSMFELKRIPGQPVIAWKEVKKSQKSSLPGKNNP